MDMTPRQRWLALLAGKTPDRIPTDYQATDEVTARLLKELGCENQDAFAKRLHIDQRRYVNATWKLKHHPDDPEADVWGVHYTDVPYEGGSYHAPTHHPLAHCTSVSDINAYAWPDPDDFDYEPIARTLDQDDGEYPIHCGQYEPFLIYGYMRGLERAFEDLILAPDIAEAALGHLFDFHHEWLRRMFEVAGKGRIDTSYVAEDLASQTGPLMSLEMYRRFLLPNQIRMADLIRSHGIHVMYHTDGAARTFLPDLIDKVGIEILNPIQWRCSGMEREALVRDFGDRIIFHGSIDNQETLSFGSVQQVVDEVKESLDIYRDTRWICAPCHNIQPVTPTENILAMYQTIHEVGAM